MRCYTIFDGPMSLETLDLRLSPTSLSLTTSLATPIISEPTIEPTKADVTVG